MYKRQGYKSGHYLNKLLINRLLADKGAWSYIGMDDFYSLHGEIPKYTDDPDATDEHAQTAQRAR